MPPIGRRYLVDVQKAPHFLDAKTGYRSPIASIVVASCRQRGVSIAAGARAHDLRSNLLRKWFQEHERFGHRDPVPVEIQIYLFRHAEEASFAVRPLESKVDILQQLGACFSKAGCRRYADGEARRSNNKYPTRDGRFLSINWRLN